MSPGDRLDHLAATACEFRVIFILHHRMHDRADQARPSASALNAQVSFRFGLAQLDAISKLPHDGPAFVPASAAQFLAKLGKLRGSEMKARVRAMRWQGLEKRRVRRSPADSDLQIARFVR